MSRMRLGIVTSHPIQYQAPLFRALAERVDLHVYFAHQATGDNQAEAEFGVPFEWDVDLTSGFNSSFLVNVSSAPGVTQYGGCDTPDVGEHIASRPLDAMLVYGWHLKTYLQATESCRRLGIPVIARTDSYLNTPRPLPLRIAKAVYYPIFLRQFDYFAPTGTHAVKYLKHYGVPGKKMKVVPYCIDVAWFSNRATAARRGRERLRAEWGTASDEIVLLFSGKLVPRKRPIDLLEACRLLRRRGVPARAVFVGAGLLEQELREKAVSENISAEFLGFINQSNMPDVYAAADVLVLPSVIDTWGLVVNEAFACGVPAIVSDRVGCAPDMIRENLTGRVVPMGDSQRLAGAIEEFAGRMRDRAVMKALAEMTERYSPQGSAEALIAAAKAASRVQE